VQNAIISLLFGLVLTVGTLFVLRKTIGKDNYEERKALEAAAAAADVE